MHGIRLRETKRGDSSWGRRLAVCLAALAAILVARPSMTPVVNGQEAQPDAERLQKSVLLIRSGYFCSVYDLGGKKLADIAVGGMGTGFFIHPDGAILTNAHVVRYTQAGPEAGRRMLEDRLLTAHARASGQDPAAVINDEAQRQQILQAYQIRDFQPIHVAVFPDGKEYEFEILAFGEPINKESSRDVAVVKINYGNAPFLRLGDTDKMKVLDKVTLIGHAGITKSDVVTEKSNLKASVRRGEVAQTRVGNDGFPILEVSVNSGKGDSGGPVINERDEVVGLLTFGQGDSSGTGFAVSVNVARELIKKAGISETDPNPTPAPISEPSPSSGWNPLSIVGIVGAAAVLGLAVVALGVGLVFKGPLARRASAPPPSAPTRPLLAPRALLHGVSGYYAGNDIELDDRPLVIGRDPKQCQLVFPASSNGVSTRHCLLRFDRTGEVVTLEDCRSTNGTFLQSGEQLNAGQARLLRAGERFYLSGPENTFEVRISGQGAKNGGRQPGRAASPSLRGLQGEFAGQRFDLDAGQIVIGRDPKQCQIVFPVSTNDVSKRHCSLGYDAGSGEFLLQDFGSTNGTFLVVAGHSEQLGSGEVRRLRAGDRFSVGGPENLFVVQAG